MLTAAEALERLRRGNARFVAGEPREHAITSVERVASAHKQEPFAVVLGCSDARVPAGLIFDQGLGDLFVIRVAGNVVMPSQIGSVEYAAATLGTRLVVVLGHSSCGAVIATLEELKHPGVTQSPNLRAIVERVRPSVEPLLSTDLRRRPEELLARAVRANIVGAVGHLLRGSSVLERLRREEGLVVLGARYCLESGEVEFFAEEPERCVGSVAKSSSR